MKNYIKFLFIGITIISIMGCEKMEINQKKRDFNFSPCTKEQFVITVKNTSPATNEFFLNVNGHLVKRVIEPDTTINFPFNLISEFEDGVYFNSLDFNGKVKNHDTITLSTIKKKIPQDYYDCVPCGTNFNYYIFEDLWPAKGDYDMNDVTIKTKTILYRKGSNNNIINGETTCYIWSKGGSLPFGLGVEFLEWDEPYDYHFKYNSSPWLVLESGSSSSVYMLSSSVSNNTLILSNNLSVNYWNTDSLHNDSINLTEIKYKFSFVNSSTKYFEPNYFIFSSNPTYKEVHIWGFPPTRKMQSNMSLFGTENDISTSQTTWNWLPSNDFYFPNNLNLSPVANFYKSNDGMPWGMHLISDVWHVPYEKTSILDAYPLFDEWVNSNGTNYQNWKSSWDVNHIFILQ